MSIRNCYSLVIVVLLSIFAILISGCGEDDERFVGELNSSYLPISVGNWWKYVDSDYSEDGDIVVITGTTRLKDGETVLVAEVDDEKGYISRAANDMVIFHEALDDLAGELMYRPPLIVGVTWEGNHASMEVVDKGTVTTPAGVFRDCYQIDARITDDSGHSDHYSIWLAEGVGPVKIAEIDPDDQEIKDVITLSSYSVTNSNMP